MSKFRKEKKQINIRKRLPLSLVAKSMCNGISHYRNTRDCTISGLQEMGNIRYMNINEIAIIKDSAVKCVYCDDTNKITLTTGTLLQIAEKVHFDVAIPVLDIYRFILESEGDAYEFFSVSNENLNRNPISPMLSARYSHPNFFKIASQEYPDLVSECIPEDAYWWKNFFRHDDDAVAFVQNSELRHAKAMQEGN